MALERDPQKITGQSVRRRHALTDDETGDLVKTFALVDGSLVQLGTTSNPVAMKSSSLDIAVRESESVLNGILKELKKMNLHLSLLTDIDIESGDLVG